MQIQALYSPPLPEQGANSWHRVAAPGGYEWWYFDAEDKTQDVQIVAMFFDGCAFHPSYLREYDRYIRRPTRRRPPLPRDCPAVFFSVYRDGKLLAQFLSQHRPADFLLSTHRNEVRIGPSYFTRMDGGFRLGVRGTPWQMSWRGPRLARGALLSGSFTFTPILQHAAHERLFLSREIGWADHHWIIANALCEVEGKIELGATNLVTSETIRFRARGYHDHNFGTGPLGPGLKRWMWGRVLFNDQVYSFHVARGKNPARPDEAHLVEVDGGGAREVKIDRVRTPSWQKTSFGLEYPQSLVMDPVVALEDPRLIEATPLHVRISYRAICRGRQGRALCKVVYPNRLRWPALGRFVELAIEKPL